MTVQTPQAGPARSTRSALLRRVGLAAIVPALAVPVLAGPASAAATTSLTMPGYACASNVASVFGVTGTPDTTAIGCTGIHATDTANPTDPSPRVDIVWNQSLYVAWSPAGPPGQIVVPGRISVTTPTLTASCATDISVQGMLHTNGAEGTGPLSAHCVGVDGAGQPATIDVTATVQSSGQRTVISVPPPRVGRVAAYRHSFVIFNGSVTVTQ